MVFTTSYAHAYMLTFNFFSSDSDDVMSSNEDHSDNESEQEHRPSSGRTYVLFVFVFIYSLYSLVTYSKRPVETPVVELKPR
jgi:hypothetical protein